MSLAGCIALLACLGVSYPATTSAHASERDTSRKQNQLGPVQARVLRVVDGDTIRVRAQIWIGQHIEVSVRLADIDAAELNSRCRSARRIARAAKSHLHRLLAGTKVQLQDIRSGKYAGRVIAEVIGPDGSSVSRSLLDAGLAEPMTHTRTKRRYRFCTDIAKAHGR